ncbi:restriction endonuclease [candidate division KSB1 bacterium]|nr:restriction endonuclease [candidate division KSB1 bacterium]
MEQSKKYIEIVSALTTDKEFGPALDLMKGFHPIEKRWLTEEEDREPLSLLKWVYRDQIINPKYSTNMIKLAQLWLKYFPEIDDIISLNHREFDLALWEIAFKRITPKHVTYVFYPDNVNETYHKTRDLSNNAVDKISRSIAKNPAFQNMYYWVFSFPAKGPLGDTIEKNVGLTKSLKNNLGILDYSPGLLCNFLLNRGIPIEELLSPNQFEDLVGMIFKEEGWEIYRMKKTRDGGKDIIAKLHSKNPIITYIQAKRYSKNNKVGISKVKEFVATVAGDKISKGYLVSTSLVSG